MGETVSELSLHQVVGWPSASEMTVGRLLLAGALWKFYYANWLKHEREMGWWSCESGQGANNALRDDQQMVRISTRY